MVAPRCPTIRQQILHEHLQLLGGYASVDALLIWLARSLNWDSPNLRRVSDIVSLLVREIGHDIGLSFLAAVDCDHSRRVYWSISRGRLRIEPIGGGGPSGGLSSIIRSGRTLCRVAQDGPGTERTGLGAGEYRRQEGVGQGTGGRNQVGVEGPSEPAMTTLPVRRPLSIDGSAMTATLVRCRRPWRPRRGRGAEVQSSPQLARYSHPGPGLCGRGR